MSLWDSVKNAAADMSTQASEFHIKLKVTSGKQCFFLGRFENSIILRLNSEGFIYFDEIEGNYKVSGFQWDGPNYQTITKTDGVTKTKGVTDSFGREKRTGRVTGAVIGTAILPGAGTLIGAMVGTGNKKVSGKAKSKSSEKTSSTAKSFDEEVVSPAYMTLKDPTAGTVISFGFDCNSQIYGELLNVLNRAGYEPTSE